MSAIDAVSNTGGKSSTPFRAAVAAAPDCPVNAVPPIIPLLVLIGAEDTESSADWCINFAAQLENISEFEFLLIPNANHSYWAPGTKGYNEAAAKLAERRLKTFLAKHLKALR